jgi:8-oxo-dGTP pyrophosphatase MutT (NUDIX family)
VDALVREFDEEFGVALEPLYLLGETSFFHHGRKRALAAWVCRLGPDRAFHLSEHLEIRWLPCVALEALDLVDSDRKLLPLVRDCLEGSRDSSGTKT